MRNGNVGKALVTAVSLLAPALALACPGHGYAQEDPSPWSVLLPVALLMGVPGTVFALLVPSPLGIRQRVKLWPIQLWGAVLGAVLLFTMAWNERAAWRDKVEETIRRKFSLEALLPAWKTLAQSMPDTYRAVMKIASVMAVAATLYMWGWTIASPHVTWGEGLEVPVTFALDSVLTFVAVRWMMRRAGFHLAAGLNETQGRLWRVAQVVFRGALMGAASGWLLGTWFGLSSGVQTVVMMDMPVHLVPRFMVEYGLATLGLGAVATAVMGLVVLAAHRQPRALLAA